MTDKPVQLDLTAQITDVPQANSLPLYIRLIESIHRGKDTVGALATHLAVEERTVNYYLDFGRWLGMIRPGNDLTETGHAFAESVSARSRLFTQALFSKDLVQAANAIKRDSQNEDGVETLDSREACLRAIKAMARLSLSTAERRASGLGHMLDAAVRATRIDWQTGEPLTEYRNVSFDFAGRTFITALAGRQFGSNVEYRVGFPKQVRHFVEYQGEGLNSSTWKRASYDSADNKATWFGSIPVNENTLDIAKRGGRDLRKLVTMCAPYVALAIGLLTYRDTLKRPSVKITNDMYGMRFWEHDRDLGPPIEVIEKLAQTLGLEPVRGVPQKLRHASADLTDEAADADLIFVLTELRIIKAGKDTSFEMHGGVEDELREGSESSPSVIERLQPVYDAIKEMLRSY